MERPGRSHAAVLGLSAVLAILVPVLLRAYVRGVLDIRVRPALAHAMGEDVGLDGVEFELLGTLRLHGLRIGKTFAADTVEASVGLATLMRGAFAADEIRVERPRVAVSVAADGTIAEAALLARVRDARQRARAAGGSQTGGRKVRRILVTGGEMVVTLVDHGEIRAADVELHPEEGGVRVIAGHLSTKLAAGPWRAEAAFERLGVDVTLPELKVGRAALDGGTVSLSTLDHPPLELDHAAVSRTFENGAETTRVDARLAEKDQPVKLTLSRKGGGFELAGEATRLPLAPFGGALPSWLDAGGAMVSGKLSARSDPQSGELWLSVDGDLEGLRAEHQLLAAEPLPMAGHLVFEGSLNQAAREAAATVKVTSGALSVSAQLDLGWTAEDTLRRAHLVADLPPTPCGGALAAIPRPLRARLDGLDMEGTIAGHIEIGADLDKPEDTVLDMDLDVKCKVMREPPSADVTALLEPFDHKLPTGEIRRMEEDAPDYVSLKGLPSHVTNAFVAGEDARFFRHPGFDEVQLQKSFAIDVSLGKVERGGSTISQQLVKNLYLGRERTLGRKLIEALLTWRLEDRVPKKRILELYLNVIQLDDDVYGLGPASLRWFDKDPEELTVAEAAFLAALTPAPKTLAKRLADAGGMEPGVQKRVDAVLRSMRNNHMIDGPTYEHARHEALHPKI